MSTERKTPLVSDERIEELKQLLFSKHNAMEPMDALWEVLELYKHFFRKRHDELQQAKAEIDRLKALLGKEWIPVAERLPNPGVCVLVRVEITNDMVNQLGDTVGVEVSIEYDTGKLVGETVEADHFLPEMQCATHWMPLPEAPITSPTPEVK